MTQLFTHSYSLCRVTAVLLFLCLLPACQQPEAVDGGFLSGNYALVPHNNTVHVVNISDPEDPRFVTQIELPGKADTVQIFGQRATIDYLTLLDGGGFSPGGLQIVDLSQPKEPVLLGQMTLEDFSTELLLVEDQAFRATYDHIDSLNLEDPGNVYIDTSFGSRANALASSDSELLAVWGGCGIRAPRCAAQLTRYALADSPPLTAKDELTITEMPGYDLLMVGDYAVVGGYGVWVTNLAQSPLEVSSRLAFEGNPYYETQLAHQENILYVLQDSTLHLLDSTKLPELTEVGSITLPHPLAKLTVRGAFAYIAGESLAGGSGELFIVDVSDATRPFLVSRYDPTNP